MEIKHIKELMSSMGRTGTKKIVIKKEGFELELEQHESGTISSRHEASEEAVYRHENVLAYPSAPLQRGSVPKSTPPQTAAPEEVAGSYINSPMVGTFYATPAPDEPFFVKVGDKVEKHTVVCIIEAMKVMNEVKAGIAGTIAEVLVDNGQPVEFGSKLFRIT